MPTYIAACRATNPARLSPLIALAESLMGRPIGAGLTIRNVAAIPRMGHLYLYVEAPTALAVSRLLTACGLTPWSIAQAGKATWARLIAAATTGNHWGIVDSILGPLAVPATGFEPVISTLKG